MSEFLSPVSDEEKKEMMRQIIPETGLDADFRNQYIDLLSRLENDPPQVEEARRHHNDLLDKNGFQRYLDRFPVNEYGNKPINENHQVISTLDNKMSELWSVLQEIFKDKGANEDTKDDIKEFVLLARYIDSIIMGENSAQHNPESQ